MKKGLCALLALMIGLGGNLCAAEDVPKTGGNYSSFEGDTLETEEFSDSQDELIHAAESGNSGTFTVAEMAVTGNVVWNVVRNILYCTDSGTAETFALLDVVELQGLAGEQPAEDETVPWLGILTFEEHALVCMPRIGSSEIAVPMYELGLKDGEIVMIRTWDAAKKLGSFFENDTEWYEINLLPWGDGIYLSAMDSSYVYHRYYYQPKEGSLTEAGEHSPLQCQVAFPYGQDLLLVFVSEEEDNSYELVRLDASTGETELMDRLFIGSSVSPWNFASDETENRIYFTVGSVAYRYTPGSGTEPEPFAVLPEMPSEIRNGAVAGSRYAVLNDEGKVMFVNTDGELEVQDIKVSNVAAEITVTDAASVYNLKNPDAYVTTKEGGTEANVLEDMLNASSRYDIYVVSTNTEAFQALRDRGYMADLSGSGKLTGIAADYPEAIVREVTHDGMLCAVPLFVENSCRILNQKAVCDVTGLSEEELPEEWVGFLQLLKRAAEERLLADNEEFALTESFYTATTFREQVLSWILNDCWLWLKQDESRIDRLTEVLLPVLQAFEEVDFSALGLQEEEKEGLGWFSDDGKTKLIYSGNPEIAVLDMTDDEIFWPLSLAKGEERLIPQMMNVAFINPYSLKQDLSLEFLESIWDVTDPLMKMMLNHSMNEPVVNEEYNEDIEYFEALIPQYEEAIQSAKTQGDAEILAYELEELKEFMESYRQNAYWSASEQSIAAYRALESQLRPAAPEFWSADQEDKAVLQFLDGMIDANLFVIQLKAALKMHQNEIN